MLQVNAVTRMFGDKAAVGRVSFTVEGPAFVGIIGRSGAGKSTLLRMMNRLLDATSGEILVEGRNVLAFKGAEARAWQAQCAMIFQQFNLVPRMDVAANVLHGILNRRSTLQTLFSLWPQADILKALDILERLGIAEQAPKRAEALSGGQQQRVAIARALMQDPRIILADEPIASLEPMNAKIVMDALKKINVEDGRMVIANLHTLDIWASLTPASCGKACNTNGHWNGLFMIDQGRTEIPSPLWGGLGWGSLRPLILRGIPS